MSDISIPSGLGSMYTDKTYTDATSDALSDKLNNTDLSGASSEELMSVCKDFEAYFVEQVMKSAQKMIPKDDSEDDSSSYATQMSDYYKDELLSQYSKQASESNAGNGLGIASMLYEQMKRNYNITE